MEPFIHMLIAIWLYVIAVVAVGAAVLLARNWRQWDWMGRLGMLSILALVTHMWEEWRFPGGFHYIYNMGSPAPDRYPMSELTDLITNLGILSLVAISLCFVRARNVVSAVIALLSLLEVVMHVGLAFISLNEFGPAGQHVWYAPGLVTALTGFLPLLVGYLLTFWRQTRPSAREWVAGVLMFVATLVVFIFVPETLLKAVDSPYPFESKGFYRFVPDHYLPPKNA